MAETVVIGVDRLLLLPYQAILNGPDRPVDVPADLVQQFPAAGTQVSAGPVLPEARFDAADPVAVLVWLHGHTDVVGVRGPDLLAAVAGDVRTDARD